MKYDVTIGIPVFKSKDYIVKTMESVLSQTFMSIEFLVIDDCGEDGSIFEIMCMQKQHPRGKDIHILHNDRNRGVGFCRNLIIDRSLGNYLYFMDSDDIIEPNTIQLLMDSITNHKAQIVYASYDIIDNINGASNEVYRKPSMLIEKEDELAMYAFKFNSIFHVSVCNNLIDLAFLRRIGLRFIDSAYWEDMAFTCELVTKINRAVLLSDITYHYYRRVGSLSHYQKRNFFQKDEILGNIYIVNYLKRKCEMLKGKQYLPYLCYNLEMISFYIVCHILKNFHQITPKFSYSEIRAVINHPLHLKSILFFQYKRFPNFLLWLLGRMPTPFFLPSIWLIGKKKRAL